MTMSMSLQSFLTQAVLSLTLAFCILHPRSDAELGKLTILIASGIPWRCHVKLMVILNPNFTEIHS